MTKGPVKRKVPQGRPGGAVSAVRHAAANPKPKPKKKPPHESPTVRALQESNKKGPLFRNAPKALTKPKAKKATKATGDYTHTKGGQSTNKKAKKKPGALKRLVKFARGDYTK